MASLGAMRPGYVSLGALLEFTWSLRPKASRKEIADVVEHMLKSRSFIVESAPTVYRALVSYEASNIDFGDCLIGRSGFAHGCEYTATFDRAAARTPGFRDIGTFPAILPFQ